MWKSKLFKLAYRINDSLSKSVHSGWVGVLKRWVGQTMRKVLVPEGLCSIKIDGMLMYIPVNTVSFRDYVLMPYESYTTELFRRSIRPYATVLDIGAQFGYFSMIAAKVVGSKGTVYAFEPVPSNFSILKRNIQINGYGHVIKGIQKAVGEKSGRVHLFLYEGSDSHGMYDRPGAKVKESISVDCIAIDDYLRGRPVDVIKMDIEGNEPFALMGMASTVSKSYELILFIELAPAFLRQAGVKPEDYLLQLEGFGFDVKQIDETSRSLKPLTGEVLSSNDPSCYTNLYCIKKS